MDELLHQIVGEQLSAITFLTDYYQFQFDGPTFNILTPVTVISEAGRVRSGDDQFRNLVCGQIGKVVRVAEVRECEAIALSFEDGSQLLFSLAESDYPGPEAVIFTGHGGQWAVL
ncbi:MAG: hypothetical protein ABI353_16165 [Isosphaeraceae bacterium]